MCHACSPIMNGTEAPDVFADRLLEMLNQGALALMVSIGHRTGLFDALADLPPCRSEDLAARAGLAPRYVREWLGAMVTGGIVRYAPEQGHYALPRAHSALLT